MTERAYVATVTPRKIDRKEDRNGNRIATIKAVVDFGRGPVSEKPSTVVVQNDFYVRAARSLAYGKPIRLLVRAQNVKQADGTLGGRFFEAVGFGPKAKDAAPAEMAAA